MASSQSSYHKGLTGLLLFTYNITFLVLQSIGSFMLLFLVEVMEPGLLWFCVDIIKLLKTFFSLFLEDFRGCDGLK